MNVPCAGRPCRSALVVGSSSIGIGFPSSPKGPTAWLHSSRACAPIPRRRCRAARRRPRCRRSARRSRRPGRPAWRGSSGSSGPGSARAASAPFATKSRVWPPPGVAWAIAAAAAASPPGRGGKRPLHRNARGTQPAPPLASLDGDLALHAHLLVVVDRAVELVLAGRQVRLQRAALAGRDVSLELLGP